MMEGESKGFFFEKKKQKTSWLSPAFERPYCGRSTAGEIKSFLRAFFQKSAAS